MELYKNLITKYLGEKDPKDNKKNKFVPKAKSKYKESNNYLQSHLVRYYVENSLNDKLFDSWVERPYLYKKVFEKFEVKATDYNRSILKYTLLSIGIVELQVCGTDCLIKYCFIENKYKTKPEIIKQVKIIDSLKNEDCRNEFFRSLKRETKPKKQKRDKSLYKYRKFTQSEIIDYVKSNKYILNFFKEPISTTKIKDEMAIGYKIRRHLRQDKIIDLTLNKIGIFKCRIYNTWCYIYFDYYKRKDSKLYRNQLQNYNKDLDPFLTA